MLHTLQLNRIRYNLKIFGLISGIKFWMKDIKHAHERCAYCGWYLHPQILFKGIDRPTRYTYAKINNAFVCNHCYEIEKMYGAKKL